MNATEYQKIKEIVATALDLPKSQISDYLNQQCGDNLSLRKQVELLLDLDIDDDFLKTNQLEIHSPALDSDTYQLQGQIGRIKLDRLIASGGMGEVYAGTDAVLKRSVAIKVIKAGFNLSNKGRSDFLNEAQILSSLQHPNICQVFDFFVEDEKDILVLELIEGKTLGQILRDKQNINALEIAKQVADALVVAHERGIIHRDLKPENIMINNQGQVKILDFGLARLDEYKESLTTNTNHPSNQTQISGTPGYMSPEQALGQRSTIATDLWSFGILLCELISGKKPHPEASSSDELVERSKQAEYQLPSNIGNAESKLIHQLLSPRAKDRPTARSCLNEIVRLQNLPKQRLRLAAIFTLIVISLLSIGKYTADLKEQKNKANLARVEAEKLANFMLHDLHPQLKSLGKLSLLESAAQETLAYYDNLDSEQSQKTLDKQALALIKISSVFDDQGQTQKAIDTLYKAKSILLKLNAENPANEETILRLGQAQMNIGELLTITGNYQESIKECKQAVELGQKLITNFPPEKNSNSKPTTHDRWWLRLRSMYMLADSYRRQGELNAAMEILSEALTQAKTAAQERPTLAPNYADISYMYCTTLYQIKIDQEVLEVCTLTANLSALALEASPNEFRLNFNHAIDIGFLANLYRNLKQPHKALEMINKAIEITEKLNQWEPNNQSTENDLISNLNIKAQILYEQGKLIQSQKLFERSYQMILKLTDKNEELHFVHNKLHSEIYLDKLDQAQVSADFLKSKGMKTRDLLELFAELELRLIKRTQ